MSTRVFGRIVSYIVLVLIAIIGAAPFIYLLILSFKSRLDIIIEVPLRGLGPHNFYLCVCVRVIS